MSSRKDKNKEREKQLEQAKTKKADCESAMTQMQSTMKSNNDKLSRLRLAKSQMETRESHAWGKYTSFKNYFENAANYGSWNGNKCTSTQTYILKTS